MTLNTLNDEKRDKILKPLIFHDNIELWKFPRIFVFNIL